MGILYILCGLPGSGKSYFAKNFLTGTYISRDEIRFEMVQPNEPYFSKEEQVYKEFVKRINQALEKGDCIADATHLNPSSRLKLLRAIKVPVDRIDIIWIKVPLETAIEQNNNRKDTRSFVPLSQIRRMNYSIIPPEFDEGFDTIYIVEPNKPIQIIKKG